MREIKYLTPQEAANRYGLSRSTLARYYTRMERSGRYPDGTILRTSGQALVLDTALHDFIQYEKRLKNRIPVRAFSAEATAAEMRRLAV